MNDLFHLWSAKRNKRPLGSAQIPVPMHVGLYINEWGLSAACFISDYGIRGKALNPDCEDTPNIHVSWNFWLCHEGRRYLDARTNFAVDQWAIDGALKLVSHDGDKNRISANIIAELTGRAVDADVASITIIDPSPSTNTDPSVIVDSQAFERCVDVLTSLYFEADRLPFTDIDRHPAAKRARAFLDDADPAHPSRQFVGVEDNPIMKWSLANTFPWYPALPSEGTPVPGPEQAGYLAYVAAIAGHCKLWP